MIDLDVVSPLPADTDQAGPALRVSRPVALAAVVALALFVLGGAAAPTRGLTTVLQVDGTTAAVVLGPRALFTASSGGPLNSRSGIRRHSLDDGSVQWAGQVPHGVEDLLLDDRANVLVARSVTDPEATFLDAGTGRVLWRSTRVNTNVVALTDGGALMIGTSDDAARLHLADLRTGRTIWSRTVRGLARLGSDGSADGTPTRLTIVTEDGRVTVVALADGRELAAADLGVRLTPRYGEAGGDTVEVTATRGGLYVTRRIGVSTTLTAYGDDLHIRWRAAGALEGSVEECADLICVTGERGLTALDRRDGAVRWTDPLRRYGYDLGSGGDPATHGQLVAFDTDDAADSVLLAAETGRVLRRLGRTLPIGGLLLRSDTEVPGRTWVSTRAGAPRTLGSLDTSSPYACSALGRYLACPGVTGPTTVWRTP